MRERFKTLIALLICTVLLLAFYIELHTYIKNNDKDLTSNRLLQHSAYDSYTLQAMQWREGRIKLDKDYPHLELAIYKGDYYVSFPPVPAVPMYFLTFIYGETTPSHAVVMVYNVLAFLFAFLCCRRMGSTIFVSVLGGCFSSLASACLFLSMSGGVWFLAQELAIMLTFAAFYFILRDSHASWHLGMFLLALAVGCRPFQAVYFVFFIYLLFKRYKFKILKTWTYFILPGIVAISYMVYNYIRFDNIFEFGHNYLPEFTRENAGKKFSIKYVPDRFEEFFRRHPKLTENGLEYNQFGFTFYISNVIFILMFVALIVFIYKYANKNILSKDSNIIEISLLTVLVSVHIFLFLLHATSGAWQFGARYMADAIPGALICILYCKNLLYKKVYVSVLYLLSFGMALNIFGALKMYL